MTLLVSDWDRTAFDQDGSERLYRKIGRTILHEARRDSSHADMAKLVLAKVLTEAVLRAYRLGLTPLRNVYRPFNIAVSGMPVSYILTALLTCSRAKHIKMSTAGS